MNSALPLIIYSAVRLTSSWIKTPEAHRDIEALPADDKDKIYYFIDMAITHNKTKKAFAK